MKSQPQADRGEFHHHRMVGGKLLSHLLESFEVDRLCLLQVCVLFESVGEKAFRVEVAGSAALGARELLHGAVGRATLVGIVTALAIVIASANNPLFRTIAAQHYASPRELDHPEWSALRY